MTVCLYLAMHDSHAANNGECGRRGQMGLRQLCELVQASSSCLAVVDALSLRVERPARTCGEIHSVDYATTQALDACPCDHRAIIRAQSRPWHPAMQPAPSRHTANRDAATSNAPNPTPHAPRATNAPPLGAQA